MGTVTVALPAKLKDWLDEQLEVGEINDASSYVSELVAQDRVRRNAERLQALRNRVEESRASGISPLTMDEIFEKAISLAKERGVYRE